MSGWALLFTYALFFEYFPPFTRVHLWSDVAGYHYPLQLYAFRALKEGRLPLWDAPIYSGISFVGNIQAAFLYPPTWLMYAAVWRLPMIPFKALEAFTFLHIWVAFVLGYLWLRGRTGWMAACLGAAVFACSGFMMCETLHPGVLCAAAWIPLGLWGIDGTVERRDWRPLWKVAVSAALSILAGYPAASIACLAVLGLYALCSRAPSRAAAGVGLGLAGAILLTAVQLLPTMDARSLMVGEPKYGPGAWGLLTLLLSCFVPNWFDFNPAHPTNYEPACFYFYLGLPALFAAIWALRQRQIRRYLQPLAVLSVMLFLANPPDFFVRAIERVPAIDFTIAPFHFLVGIGCMAALMTALSVDAFLKKPGGATTHLPGWMAPAAIVFLGAWSLRQLWTGARGGAFPTREHSLVGLGLSLAAFSLGLWTFRASGARRRVLLAMAILFATGADYQVFGAGRWFNAIEGDEDEQHEADRIHGMNEPAFLALSANRSYRIACDENAAPYATDLRGYDLSTPEGFDPFLPTQYRDWIARRVPFRTNRIFFVNLKDEAMLQALGVRYVITHEGAGNHQFLSQSPLFALVGLKNSFYIVYEYLRAKAPYRWEDDANGAVQLASWTPERRDLVVQSDRGGRFVLIEQFFPGWQATIDGRPAEILRYDSAFQSVVVPPGSHRLIFRFHPASLRAGAIVSGLALVGLLFVIVADCRRGRAQARISSMSGRGRADYPTGS